MAADRQQARAFALLGLVMIFWAGNSIVGRAVRFDVPPFTLALVRWAGALLIVAQFAKRDWILIRLATTTSTGVKMEGETCSETRN